MEYYLEVTTGLILVENREYSTKWQIWMYSSRFKETVSHLTYENADTVIE